MAPLSNNIPLSYPACTSIRLDLLGPIYKRELPLRVHLAAAPSASRCRSNRVYSTPFDTPPQVQHQDGPVLLLPQLTFCLCLFICKYHHLLLICSAGLGQIFFQLLHLAYIR